MNQPQLLSTFKNLLWYVKNGKYKAAEQVLQRHIDEMSQKKFEKKMRQGGLVNPR